MLYSTGRQNQKQGEIYDAKEKTVFIPNEEVRQEFVRAVKAGKHTEIAKLVSASDRLLQDTLNMNAEKVAAAIQEAHSASTAPNFYNNEQALRSVIRIAYISCIDEFLRIDELPSGHGYADVVFFPKKNSAMPLLLIELKWNKTEEGALRQIKNRDYPQALKDYGGNMLLVGIIKNRDYPQALKDYGGDMLLVGINYDVRSRKHTCRIEKYRK